MQEEHLAKRPNVCHNFMVSKWCHREKNNKRGK